MTFQAPLGDFDSDPPCLTKMLDAAMHANDPPPPPTHVIGECDIFKKDRDALEEETRKLDVCDMEEFGRLKRSEKTIAILGDRWWPQTAKQDGDRINNQFPCSIWTKRNYRPSVGGISIRTRNDAPSRKECMVNGQMTKASNK